MGVMNNKSAAIAALLSFIFPGLGHLYLGRRRQALMFALPAIVVGIALGLELLSGIDSILANLITPSGSLTILILILLAGGWRVVAMVDAVLIVRRDSGLRAPVAIFVALLLVLVIVPHAAGAYVAYTAYDAESKIFTAARPDDQTGTTPSATGDPGSAQPGDSGSPEPTDDFQATPDATPATAQSRINILLTGVDSAEQRTTALTDTLLVVSINPVDKSVVMLSLPRDISQFPLYDGRTFKGKINSLMTWARNHPKDFPDGPFPTLIKEVGYLIGVPIHYYAAIDLQGFRKMIDAVGGVTVDNPKAINDPRYDWLDGGPYGFYMKAGPVTLNGRNALAYARSRQGVGDSDFTRAARQQQLLVALQGEAELARHGHEAAGHHQGCRRHGADERADEPPRGAHRARPPGEHRRDHQGRADVPDRVPPAHGFHRGRLDAAAPHGQGRRAVQEALRLRQSVRRELAECSATTCASSAWRSCWQTASQPPCCSWWYRASGWGRTGRDAWMNAGGPWWMWAAGYGVLWASAEWLQNLDQLRARWTFRGEVGDILRAALILAVSVFSVLFLVHAPEVSRLFLVILFSVQVGVLHPPAACDPPRPRC